MSTMNQFTRISALTILAILNLTSLTQAHSPIQSRSSFSAINLPTYLPTPTSGGSLFPPRVPLTKRSPSSPLISTNILAGLSSATSVLGNGGILSSTTEVDICLDLTVSIGGLTVSAGLVASLDASIQSKGVTASQLAILQGSVNAKAAALAQTATNQYSCQSLCTAGNYCQSSHWDQSGTCSWTPTQLTSTSSLLANLIGQLSLGGCSSSYYTQLCPSNCSGSPSASPTRRKREVVGLCPVGTDACPIKSGSFMSGYECINTKEELESCGGCAGTKESVNCGTVKIPRVGSAGCSQGKCVALTCMKGYNMLSNGTCI